MSTKRLYHSLFPGLLLSGLLYFLGKQAVRGTPHLEPDLPVAEVLVRLGDEPLPHQPDTSIEAVSVARGEALVKYGITKNSKGKRVDRQSAHFVCTSCHNLERDQPDLRVSDPQAKLRYAAEKGIPFLQGSALYGAINRTRFYNGDYEKKYGDLVVPARNDLREAIQLCAVECSQGRRLNDWELESVVAYLWTIGLKMKDLQLTEIEKDTVRLALRNPALATRAIALIKSYYQSGEPATFATPPDDRKAGYPVGPADPENGKRIYDLSCKHCHENKRYSYYNLDDSPYSFQHLAKHFPRYNRYSVYQVSRYGTQPMNGKRAYMPNFTLEKMSHQQVEDLRAYVELQSSQ